ncbi:hypothetical protein B0A48_08151 [Cryoendolithus antarcticus]|uniref:Delta(24)-sterol reductase n=1 Tax=Cryoendolithus antarcticus TaxID=1507870 RepID=A0A1V8T1J1_9PEZI|nr:hypothetical protein B0A48_08151 [Cryoendolithus antarcticus]
MEHHTERVARVRGQVRCFHGRGEQYRIFHGSTSTTRRTKLSHNTTVDTSQLKHMSIDVENRLAKIEPNVSMEVLAAACLAVGLMPPVVMEFPAITVGGGFAGTAGESSSFKHGLFDKTITKLEMILANGEVVEASYDVRPDLFHAAAGSFGTLGVITLLEMPLFEAKPYVEVIYTTVTSMEDAVTTIEDLTANPSIDYLEGIMYSLTSGIIISGRLVSAPSSAAQIHRFTRPSDPWFYLHAESRLHQPKPVPDYVPLKDYLFRYDRGSFWAGTYAFSYFLTPFNALTRKHLDPLLHNDVMYRALHVSHLADEYVVQDIGFPYATATEFVGYLDEACGFYPLWLCPLKMPDSNLSLRPQNPAAFAEGARSKGMMLNIGLWGPGPQNYDAFVHLNRAIERKTTELGGLKCFYAQGFFTEEEFWGVYDRGWYEGVRRKYGAEGLRGVWQKLNAAVIAWRPRSEMGWRQWARKRVTGLWPLKGLWGALSVLLGRDGLLRGK